MNVGKKLALINLLMAAAVIVVASTLSHTVVSSKTEFEVLHDRNLEITSLLEKIRSNGLRIVSSTSEYLLFAFVSHHLTDTPERDKDESLPPENQEILTATREMEQLTASYRALVVASFPDEIGLLETVETSSNKLVQESLVMIGMRQEAVDLPALLAAKERFEETEQAFLSALDAALTHEEIEHMEVAEELNQSIARTNNYVWASLLGVALLVLIVGGMVVRSITGPLSRLSIATESISKGDYSQVLESGRDDEIGMLQKSFNIMAEQLEANKQLQQEFIAELEQKNTELERFTYTVSHDLKSPLVTVKGFLGMLERDIESGNREGIEKDIAFLKDATDTMGTLLTDLLELSRVGRVVNPSTRFPMTELCSEVVDLLQVPIQQQQAEVELMPDMPHVHADRDRIREVIQNLLENAIKFAADDRPPRIKIYAESQDGSTRFTVEDNGMGIDERYYEKVFKLFERLDPNISGTGIGLALVKRIIETHGGEIWIDSPAGSEGTRFCFTLPHSMEEQDVPQPEAVNK